MADERDVVNGKDIVTQRLWACSVQALDLKQLATMPKVDCWIDAEMKNLIVKLTAVVRGTNGRKIEWEVSYPKTWWDHWKRDMRLRSGFWGWVARHLSKPKLTLRSYTDHAFENMCPHLPGDKEHYHLSFLADGLGPTQESVKHSVIRRLRFAQDNARSSRDYGHESVVNALEGVIDWLEAEL